MEKALNTPIEVVVGDKKLFLSEYSLSDFSDFSNVIKADKIKFIQNTIDDKEMRLTLIKDELNSEISDNERAKKMNTAKGIAYLLWCMAKRNQEIELQEVVDLVKPDNLEDIANIMAGIIGTEDTETAGALKKK